MTLSFRNCARDFSSLAAPSPSSLQPSEMAQPTRVSVSSVRSQTLLLIVLYSLCCCSGSATTADLRASVTSGVPSLDADIPSIDAESSLLRILGRDDGFEAKNQSQEDGDRQKLVARHCEEDADCESSSKVNKTSNSLMKLPYPSAELTPLVFSPLTLSAITLFRTDTASQSSAASKKSASRSRSFLWTQRIRSEPSPPHWLSRSRLLVASVGAGCSSPSSFFSRVSHPKRRFRSAKRRSSAALWPTRFSRSQSAIRWTSAARSSTMKS